MIATLAIQPKPLFFYRIIIALQVNLLTLLALPPHCNSLSYIKRKLKIRQKSFQEQMVLCFPESNVFYATATDIIVLFAQKLNINMQ